MPIIIKMSKCFKCLLVVAIQEQLKCCACSKIFHYLCADKDEENYRKMGQRRQTWKCNQCKGPKDNIPTNTLAKTAGNPPTNPLSNPPNPSEVLDLEEHMRELKLMIADLNKKVENSEKKMDNMIGKFDDLKKNYEEVLAKQEKLEQENTNLRQSITQIKELYEDKNDMLENRTRNSNIEIKNMPETAKEDVVKIVELIGKAVGLQDIKEGDIQVAHRVDPFNKDKNKGQRAIVVHMGSRYLRNKWLKQYKIFNSPNSDGQRKVLTAKCINKNLPDTPIYLNEHITGKRKNLLNATKAFAKENHFKYVWVKDAFILIKKEEEDKKVLKISTMNELEELKKQSANFKP